MEKIIEVSHLRKSYKNIVAVNDISFDVHRGSLFAFLGLNGAGKSTTINIICGILAKDAGEVRIKGYDIDRCKLAAKKELGVVFQNSVLDKKVSVLDNLRFRAGLYGIVGQAFRESLDRICRRLSLSSFLARPLEKLSGGQRRRVDIARALIHNPSILIMDEPTTGLDPQTRITVWNILKEMQDKDGLTVFLTTHYMEEADDADYVTIIDQGKIIAEDTPNGLKTRYAGNYIKLYSRSPEEDKLISENGLTKKAFEEYDRIEVKSIAEAKRLIIGSPSVFEDFEIIKGNMDDVFLNVTGKEFVDENISK